MKINAIAMIPAGKFTLQLSAYLKKRSNQITA